MLCKKCGYDAGEHKFCPECGTKIEEINEEISVTETPSADTVEENNNQPDPVPTEPQKNEGTLETKKSNTSIFKKLIAVAAALAVVIVLIAVLTHKSDAVKACISYIDAIPENINIYSDAVISLAEKSYDDLSKSDKRKVKNHKELVKAREKCDKLIADSVELEIDKLSDKSELYQIQNVRNKYDNLTESQKSIVDNLDELQSYEESYYDDMISDAIEKIDNISYVNGKATAKDEDAIKEAQETYDKIDDNYKEKVVNYDKLEGATASLKAFYLENAQELIDESIKSGKGFSNAEEAYNKLTDEQKKEIKNYKEFNDKYDEYKNKSPIRLIGYRLGSNSINNPEFFLQVKNESDQIIKGYTVSVFAYDNDGVPVSLGYNSYIKNLDYDEAIKPGAVTSYNYYWTFYGTYDRSSMKKIVVIVKDVSFFDGSSWSNPNYGSLCEKYEQQIISPDDANILSMG